MPNSLNKPANSRFSRTQLRTFKDKLTAFNMAFGGIGVIIAILLIFFYLLFIVYPLFVDASVNKQSQYSLSTEYGKPLHLAIEEQNKVAVQYTDLGYAIFFNVANGITIKKVKLFNGTAKVTSFKVSQHINNSVIFGLSNGQAAIAKHHFKISYPNDKLHIEPSILFPAGETPLLIDENKKALVDISYQAGEDKSSIVAYTEDDRLVMTALLKEEGGLLEEDDESATVEFTQQKLDIPQVAEAKYVLLDPLQRLLYVADRHGETTVLDTSNFDDIKILETVNLLEKDQQLTQLTFLTGGISLLVGSDKGGVAQWFPVNKNNIPHLTFIRQFDSDEKSTISDIEIEQRRKGFITANKSGHFTIYNATAQHDVASITIPDTTIDHLALSPRADLLLTVDQHDVTAWHIDNEHPEMSWSILWDKIWYESYTEPTYTWQSSSADNDFEPKYSFMPLAFGTLKAAFYAMLFAIPLALMGAIYTAYFMAPKMRSVVKPTIEIMEALPTVILGFLAGLWLAPFLEANLVGVFGLLIVMPIGILLFAFSWQKLPKKYRLLVPDGWLAALLIPVVLFLGWFALNISPQLEIAFFGGDIKHWIKNSLGLDFDQRNSLVVGIAMGIAVIPTIFSIAEDAIFSVPKHLTFGSLALGATPWQTLTRVIILTASPGIFSAIMIGMGRAVGETMIVLMATGNTPVMDLSIFQGMRTLSANIAVEMPEAEVDSSHYRILFLAALVLFMFTFVFNTAAEIVRQRLRKKYSSL